MHRTSLTSAIPYVFSCLLVALTLKTVGTVFLDYREYFPPNFDNVFLSGRQSYFFGTYRWAFYPHIVAGPLSLVLGILLSSELLRRRRPRWHRILGRVQVVCVLGVVVPSGLIMAGRAETGLIAGLGFTSLAIVTGGTVLVGWRRAMQRRYEAHRIWMRRCLCCLGSAVVIRITGGLTLVMQLDASWIYPTMAWMSWVAPLAVMEFVPRLWRIPVQREIAMSDSGALSSEGYGK